MEDAPRNGDIILVKFNEWNDRNKPEQCAYAQWGCDQFGNVWTWRAPYRMGTVQNANGWRPYQDFLIESQRPEPGKPELEFDL